MIAASSNSSPKSYTLSPSQRPRSKRSSFYSSAASNSGPSQAQLSASPKPSFSIRSAPSSHHAESSSSSSSAIASPPAAFAVAAAPRSPRRATRDCGTQYSPLAWPPTTRPFVSRTPSAQHAASQPHQGTAAAASADQAATTLAVQDPPEPQVRLTPQPVQGVGATGRRSRSSPSGTSGEASTAATSPSKKPRKRDAAATVMPRDYAKCDPKELAVVISDMLLELIRVNDEIPLQDGQLTRFHSRAPPGISVRDYLHRLTYHATLPPPILLAMVTYVDKLCAMFPAFRINSLTVHRFLITAATVASKGLSDSFWTNSTYSKVGGVTIKELALLELELLERVEWRIVPKPEVLEDYYANLVDRSENHVLEGDDASE